MPAVLVVDDERFFRDAIRDALSEAHIECVTAESGEEALKAAEDPAVAVVVLDLQLGGMAGTEVLERLRKARPLLRVIVLSTHADQDRVLEALRLHACDYLAKPLHLEELVLSVRRALASHRVEEGGAVLRDRLTRLEASLHRLETARQGTAVDSLEWLLASAAEAVADVLGASKTSVMRLVGGSTLVVAAVTGRSLPTGEMDRVPVGEGAAGVVFASDEGLAVARVAEDDRFAGRVPADRYRSDSFAITPIPGREGPQGVLCAADRESDEPFGDDDLALLRILALHLGPWLEDGGRPGAGREADAEMAREICDVVAEEADPRRLVDAALRPVARGLPAAPVALYMIEDGELTLEGQCDGMGAGDRPNLPMNRGLTGTVLQTGRLVATDDPAADARFDREVDTPSSGAVGPLLCVPIRLRGKVLGVVRAFPSGAARASAATGELLSASLSAAIRSVLLYRSLLESIDEVADARRAARGGPRSPGR